MEKTNQLLEPSSPFTDTELSLSPPPLSYYGDYGDNPLNFSSCILDEKEYGLSRIGKFFRNIKIMQSKESDFLDDDREMPVLEMQVNQSTSGATVALEHKIPPINEVKVTPSAPIQVTAPPSKRKFKLRRHPNPAYQHLIVIPGDPPIYHCIPCDTRIESNTVMEVHMPCKNKYWINFNCGQCGNSIISRSQCESHMKLHDLDRHPCSKCPKVFISEYSLNKHMDHHAVDDVAAAKPIVVKQPESASDEEFISSGSRDEPFSCRKCEATFPHLGGLRRHFTIHSKKDPWHKCDQCHFVTRYPQGLRNHKQQKHEKPDDNQEETGGAVALRMKIRREIKNRSHIEVWSSELEMRPAATARSVEHDKKNQDVEEKNSDENKLEESRLKLARCEDSQIAHKECQNEKMTNPEEKQLTVKQQFPIERSIHVERARVNPTTLMKSTTEKLHFISKSTKTELIQPANIVDLALKTMCERKKKAAVTSPEKAAKKLKKKSDSLDKLVQVHNPPCHFQAHSASCFCINCILK